MGTMKHCIFILETVIAYFDDQNDSVADPGVDKADIYLEFDGELSEDKFEQLWDILLEDGLVESLALNEDGILMYAPTDIGYETAAQLGGIDYE